MARKRSLGNDDAVEIAAYDSAWPAAYEREGAQITGALGDLVAAIEHIGSTAVPGLGAKPIIDIMVGVRHVVDGERCVAPLEGLGYFHKGLDDIPGHRYFRKPVNGKRTHQIHMVEVGGEFWERHLLFRDYLRTHPDAAHDYFELKLRLAERYRHDRVGYNEAKTEFIESALRKARAAAK